MVWSTEMCTWGLSEWGLSLKFAGGDVSRGRRDEESCSLKELPYLMTEARKICRKKWERNSYRRHEIQKQSVCQGGSAHQQS